MTAGDPGRSHLDRAWAVLPYLFILVPAAFALLRDHRPDAAALASSAAAWHWFMVTSSPGRTRRPVPAIVYLVVMLAVVGALVRISPMFTVTGVVMFIQSFVLLPGRWAYAGVTATAAVLVLSRAEPGRSAGETVYSFLVAVLVASAVGLVNRAVVRQSDQRRAMIAQLRESAVRLAALAEENADLQARLLARAREAGVLAERQRMAREIHDTIAQSLIAILTQIEAAGNATGETSARLDTIRTLAAESLNEARRSVQALRPASLDGDRLVPALRDLAERWSRTTGVPAPVEVTGDPRPLHEEVEITLLRVAQEALANVAKHAAATRVGLTLSYMEDVAVLDVRDDGSGFVPDEAAGPTAAGGFGLVAMRQRVTRLAGRLEVETAPGLGTGIAATVPAIPPDPEPERPGGEGGESEVGPCRSA